MIVDPLPIMKKYLMGKQMSQDEIELLLFVLYIENVKTNGTLTMAALKGRNVLTRCVCGAELELEQ